MFAAAVLRQSFSTFRGPWKQHSYVGRRGAAHVSYTKQHRGAAEMPSASSTVDGPVSMAMVRFLGSTCSTRNNTGMPRRCPVRVRPSTALCRWLLLPPIRIAWHDNTFYDLCFMFSKSTSSPRSYFHRGQKNVKKMVFQSRIIFSKAAPPNPNPFHNRSISTLGLLSTTGG